MSKQPYEIVLNFSDQPSQDGRYRKIRRSRQGCFNCRKRKKKCDEQRPICSSCLDRCIQCVWPTGNEKVPENYKIPPVDKKLVELKKKLQTDDGTGPDKPHPSSPLMFEDVVHLASPKPQVTTPSSSSSGSAQSAISPPILQQYPAHVQLYQQQQQTQPVHVHTAPSPEDMFLASQQQQQQQPEAYPMPLHSNYSSVSIDGSIDLNEGRIAPGVDLFEQVLFSSHNLIPHERDRFMSAAINGFITSLGPQYTHPLLTTSATFTPVIQTMRILETIAEACGAAFLSWTNPDLTELSSKKYALAMDELHGIVRHGNHTPQDEMWLSCGFQLLVLAAKVTWGCDNLISVKNLKMSYEIIKRKIRRHGSRVNSATKQDFHTMPRVMEPNAVSDPFVEGIINNDSLNMEIENTLVEYKDEPSGTLFERQFQRMFVESFIYNYSICILVTPNSEGLPNPFEVFRDTRRYLKTPLFSCDVAFMNNPVVGPSFDAFELAAKSSYLLKHLDEPWVYNCALKLLEMADYYPPPMLPPEVRHDVVKYESLKDSILVSEIVMKAAKIIIRKVINPSIREFDPAIQRDVSSIVFKLKRMRPVSAVRVIVSWALFVAGVACIDEEHRAEIINSCLVCAEMVHGRYIYTIIGALEVAWGRESKLGFTADSRGLDVLLDTELLKKVFI